MPKICIIAIYFGPWPATFPLFLHSISRNKDVDFIILSDNDPIDHIRNIKYIKTNLEDVKFRFSEAFGREVRLKAPYKICDYRPMFGEIFSSELDGYDFWGHCDIDIVFGRINSFITREITENYDKILVRGNFSLYRNCEYMNEMYRHLECGPDWRLVINSDDNFLFDEWPGIYQILKKKQVSIYMDEVILDIRSDSYCMQKTHERFIYPQVMFYEDGRIYRFTYDSLSPQEFLLIHLQKRRLSYPDFQIEDSSRIYFTPSGFTVGNKGVLPSIYMMKEINPQSYLKDLDIFLHRIKRRFKKFFE